MNEALAKSIEIIGGTQAMADLLNVGRSCVINWQRRHYLAPPPRYCLTIQLATNGRVTVHDLRPDIFGPMREVCKGCKAMTDLFSSTEKAFG